MIHDANRCLCEDCMDYRDRVLRARRRMGLRPIPQIPPVAATRDAAAGGPTTHKEKRSAGHPTGQVVTQGDASRVGVADDLAAQLPQTPSVRVTRDPRTEGSNPEPVGTGLGQMSSTAGETLPIPRDAAGAVLDDYPASIMPRVSGLTVHRGPFVAARAATNGEPRLGEAS